MGRSAFDAETRFLLSPPQREHVSANSVFPRHRHAMAHAAIVLSGGFEEASDSGRRHVEPGDVLVHQPFSAHAERGVRETSLFNLALPFGYLPSFFHGTVDDPDALMRECQRNPADAVSVFIGQARPAHPRPIDWPDLLAAALQQDEALDLRQWAEANQLHPTSVARGFGQVFGISPAGFRVERRARRAWQRIVGTDDRLSTIAHELRFSDQAHMCRDVRALTGKTPSGWRALINFNTPPRRLAFQEE